MGDVLVLGGGPAGSSAARLLASWGHSVRMITRQPGDARLAVSVPPSTGRLFDVLGISGAIADAGFIRSTGNTVWWGADKARIESFSDGARGWQVPTDQLERVLLEQAAAAGVTIERRPIVEGDLSRHGGGAATAEPFVIDATGRSGVMSRMKNLREYDAGPRTVALVGEWQRPDAWQIADQSHTLVESYESGWAWSVPTADRARHIAVMVDPQRSGLSRDGSARVIYEHEIAKTRMFRGLIEGATLTGGPWGWDASTYRARHYAGDGWVLAGDAGWFVDPLSSAGVKKALASGWLAAIVANTSIARPEMRAHAQQFFSDRETTLERHFTSVSRSFLAAAAPNHPHAFWIDRADTVGEAAEDTAAIQAAFEQLRAAPDLRVRSNPAVQVEPRPMIEDREIVLRPHLVRAGQAGGVRYLSDVDVVVLVEMAPRCREVPELLEAYQEKMGPVPFPNVLRALAGAIAKGWLVRE